MYTNLSVVCANALAMLMKVSVFICALGGMSSVSPCIIRKLFLRISIRLFISCFYRYDAIANVRKLSKKTSFRYTKV